jgi:hypothetical protein
MENSGQRQRSEDSAKVIEKKQYLTFFAITAEKN